MNDRTQLLLLVGSYSPSDKDGIHVYRLIAEGGVKLERLSGVDGIANPTFLNVDADAKRLYAIGEHVNAEGIKEGEVAAYSIDFETGELGELSRTGTMKAEGGIQTTTCHINRDSGGRFLTVASYHGGKIGIVELDAEGRTVRLTDTAVHTGHGADPVRQDRPHPHCVVFSPDERYLFACDLGLDLIRAYRVDRDTLKLEKHGDTKLHPGSGPRHFAFHPDGHSAYVINEVDSTITAFTYDADKGQLSVSATYPALPSGFEGENTCGEITLSPDGRFLYGSNRGHDSIVVYEVKGPAELEYVEHVSTRGGHPRHFALTPDGAYLITANRDGNNLVVFQRNAASGKLDFTGIEAGVSKPVCVKPVEIRV
ncbi:lactonase family protein [Paenibacillus sp. HN-1]|uniref:lactonase family protein n=1 Tax=Paenibacillus TaxID=44249 RepID=UPI001CA8787A|nr:MULTISPECIES: lactonase family protein [Paenibacillus]MBY9082252.1 lactonase family protein [Paenibacillus sp. CGMCC 1.18879]MBY9086384.1 lactonase family protein [Paenibacillus sinensis]